MQGDLLARVLLQPEREWTVSSLARDLRAPVISVQDEITRLVDSRILSARPVGRARVLRPNVDSPVAAPLTQLTLVTFGPQTVVTEEFADLGAEHVVVFGSWAARYFGEPGPYPADMDVLVVGDDIARQEVHAAAERAETRLGMVVNPGLRPTSQWQHPDGHPLVIEIQGRPYVDVMVTP